MIRRICAAACPLMVALLAFATPASAQVAFTHSFLGSFDGSDTTAGTFGSVGSIAINQSTGAVYVLDYGKGVIDQFNPAGVAQSFSDPSLGGASSFTAADIQRPDNDLAVEPGSGRIYPAAEFQPLHAYAASGAELGGLFPLSIAGVCGDAVDQDGQLWVATRTFSSLLTQFNTSGSSTGSVVTDVDGFPCNFAFSVAQPSPAHPTGGYAYVWANGSKVQAYQPSGSGAYSRAYKLDLDAEAGPIAVDPSDDHIYLSRGSHIDEYYPNPTDPSDPGGAGAVAGAFAGGFGDPDVGNPTGICSGGDVAVSAVNHYIYAAGCGRVNIFGPGSPYTLPTTTTGGADSTGPTATLHGTVDPDNGGDTTDCYFKWGLTAHYTSPLPADHGTTPCVEGAVYASASGVNEVTAQLSGLSPSTTYHYRLFSANAKGVIFGDDHTFTALGPPQISNDVVSDVNTDGVNVSADISPTGAATTYHFEWGSEDCATHVCANAAAADAALNSPTEPQTVTAFLSGLTPDTTYHFRVVATNSAGIAKGEDRTFTTFPAISSGEDPCPNSHVRQQTGAGLLLDCRAYELVSAPDTGGYNVQSDLIPGQQPLPSYPQASDRLLYALHFGTIPGIEGPTNLGLDPYVASRGDQGWSSRYVGIPVSGTPATSPFGSPLLAASAGLDSFAFDGPNICNPCFADGKTGIPVRGPDGVLTQGMAGSIDPGAGVSPAGDIDKPFSANGHHFVFGTTSKLEEDANSGGDVSIYDRDLTTGVTHVVSKTPGGATMTGAGIAELDISADGSRILLGKRVATDAAGNTYWHLYMNIGDVDHTIDLTPNAPSGVLYAGMTDTGAKVFFTTADKVTADDHDTSADLYRVDVDGAGATPTRLSTGTSAGDTNSCDPIPSQSGTHWNAVGAAPSADCGVLALAGGAGVATGDGSAYFISPEILDSSNPQDLPAQDAPNLYISRPGSAPHFVATLGPDSVALTDALTSNEVHNYADFQVTPNGDDAAFASSLPLTGFPNRGHSEVYRYDAPTDALACASCAPTGVAATSNVTLSEHGLNLSDDGRVFFSSAEPLVLRDTNHQPDAYEWSDGAVQLVSTGTSPFPAGLMSVNSDGTDAFFYTHDTLVPADQNGNLVKIYDARAFGGFPYDPPSLPCQASDECHGPGTQAAGVPRIQTVSGPGARQTTPSSASCKRGTVKRHGRCVPRRHRKHVHRKHVHRKHVHRKHVHRTKHRGGTK